VRDHRALEIARIQGAQPQRRYLVADASVVGEARRGAQELAQGAGLGETAVGRVGIVVTELANNLVRHAGGGEVFVQVVQATNGAAQLEVMSVDSGPGMADVDQCLRDGYSTSGTPGNGLGAVRRLSALFDLFSVAGRGCVIVSRIGSGEACAFGAVCTAMRGETVSGDCWRLALQPTQSAAVVMDGLGHGEHAAEAAQAGASAFSESPFDLPEMVIERVHARLHGSRGAAGACLQRSTDGRLRFVGIGNISARACGPLGSQGMASHTGILGVQARRLQQFEYDGRQHPLLVMHSDGVAARWDLNHYEGLRGRHPAVIAAVLYRDHRRERDDATILVVAHG
jgi:anti-sigma regulatory factor (Ser/Thr protein kinase)